MNENHDEQCPRCPACGLHKHKGSCEEFVTGGQQEELKEER